MAVRPPAHAPERRRGLPAAPTHGDFHAHNACAGGAIDLERGGLRGPAGYDAVAGLLVPELFPPAPDAYRYTARQRRRYLAALDALFVPRGLPPPSAHAADVRFCALLACLPDRDHRPAQQQWLYARYRTELDVYVPPRRPAGGAACARGAPRAASVSSVD